MEFDGLVEMPEGIALDDFEAWAAIATEDPSQLALEELSLALQVSDKLSAYNSTQLARALAAKLKTTDWRSASEKEAMLHALLSLNKNMQLLVFREAGTLSAPALFSWPIVLQQAYSDLWVSPRQGKPSAFTISEGHSPASVLRFLDLLSRTDPTLPGLSSLSLPCAIPTAEAATLLCSVLLHHSALAALDMPRLSCAPCSPWPPAATVFRTLPQLTGITSVTLSAPCLPPSPTEAATEAVSEVVQAMAAAISALPCLETFRLRSPPPRVQQASGHSRTRNPGSCATGQGTSVGPAPKRRRIVACMGPGGNATTPPSLDPVIAALSTAPSLTYLDLFAPGRSAMQRVGSDGISGPFRTLRCLYYDCTVADGVDQGSALRPTLQGCAPLPALATLAYSDTSRAPEGHCALLRSVFADAACHPALTGVSFEIGPQHGDRLLTDSVYLSWRTDAAPMDVTASVRMTCMNAQLVRAMSVGLSSLTPPASFTMFGSADRTEQDALLDTSQDLLLMLQSVTAPPHLQEFAFHWNCDQSAYDSRARTVCDAVVAQPLAAFSVLTDLQFHMPAAADMQLHVLTEHFAAMPQLREVSMEGFRHGGAAELEACFAPLTALVSLRLAVRPVTADAVRAFARLACGMANLVEASLRSCDSAECNPAASGVNYAEADWCHALLELPSKAYYEFQCSNKLTPDSELEAVKAQLIARGAHIQGQFEVISFVENIGEDRAILEDQ